MAADIVVGMAVGLEARLIVIVTRSQAYVCWPMSIV